MGSENVGDGNRIGKWEMGSENVGESRVGVKSGMKKTTDRES